MNWAISKIHYFNSLPGSADLTILEEADGLCRRAIRLEPDNIWALNAHGVILKKLERLDQASKVYERVTELKPDWYAAWVNLGTVHALQGDLPRAEHHLRLSTTCATLDDRYAVDTWRNLASLQLHLGKINEAQDNIRQALECNRDDMASSLIQARLLLSADPKAAVESGVNANNLAEGREPKVHRILALAYLRTGRFDMALDSARKALDGGDIPAINRLILAIASARLDDLPSSRSHLDRALAAWPDDCKDERAFRATADKGALWFESAEELAELRTQADELIDTGSPVP